MLMNYLVTLGSRKGDMVLDPFMGSGTTAYVSKKLKRKWIGIEKELNYIKLIKKRLKSV